MRPFERLSVRLAAVVLALLSLIAIFADLLACEYPLLAAGESGYLVLPRVTAPGELSVRARGELDQGLASGWAIWAPVRAGPDSIATVGPNAPPSAAHPLGTDGHARDVLAVVIHGTRTALGTTLVVLLLSLIVGLALGTWAGQGPPLADAILARGVELTGAVPAVVALALLHASGASTWLSFVIVVATLRSAEIARLVRGEVLRVGGNDYVLAARAIGGSTLGVIRRHVMPHVWGPVLVSSVFAAASVVALEAATSFLGLTLPGTLPTWGGLLGQPGSGIHGVSLLVPAAAIVLTTGCLYHVGDALDDWVCARRGGPSRV